IQDTDEATKVSRQKRQQIEGSLEENIKLYNRNQPMPPAEQLRIPSPQSQAQSLRPASTASNPVGGATTGYADRTTGNPAPLVAETTGALNASDPAHPAPEIHSGTPAQPAAGGSNTLTGTQGVEGFTLQVAAVQSQEKAGQLLDELIARGYAAYIVRSETDDQTWYRVRIGYFVTQQDAAPLIKQLEAERHNPILIKL
ncbi:MAG: SPOR domain-containing protein, partial [Desulfatitalea sp.]|nr:SPOR domain-containing protein [Desulfatitalea sp.]